MQPSRIPGYRDPSKAKSLETDTQEGGDEPPPPRGGQGEGESWGELQPGYSTRQGRRGRGPNSASTVCLHSSTTQKQQHTNHVCNLTFLAHVLNV